jgi:hypothetical protein
VLAAAQAEEVATGVAHFAGPAQRRRRLTLAGIIEGIAWPDGETREEI